MKHERELREISLRQIADSTKISMRFLVALESNNFQILPAEVFTRGFVREVAKHLGLNPEETLASYLAERGLNEGEESKTRRRKQEESERWGRNSAPHSIPVTQVKPDKNLMATAGIVLLLIALVSYHTCGDDEKTAGIPAAATPAKRSIQAHSVPATPAPASPAGVQIELEFTADSWARIEVDGVEQETLVITAGERRSINARDAVILTLGNAGGVVVTVNGRRLAPLGAAGEVVRRFRIDAQSGSKSPTS